MRFDPREHPRWPRGAPAGRGGEFRGRAVSTSWAAVLSGRVEGTPLWRDRAKIDQLVDSTPTFRSKLRGGGIATTQILTYGDAGTHLVRKKFTGLGQHRASAEVLASRVADVVGAPAPIAVLDPNDRSAVYMGYVPGDLGLTHNKDHAGGARYYLAQTDAGLRIGLLDVLIRNEDRHNENWILSSELSEPGVIRPWEPDSELRKPVAIDHSETFFTGLVKPGAASMQDWEDGKIYPIPNDDMSYPGFMSAWLRPGPYFGGPQFVRDGVIDPNEGGGFYRENNPLHPDDVPVLRARLEALRLQFHGHEFHTEYEQMMARFEALAAHAGGTRRLFP